MHVLASDFSYLAPDLSFIPIVVCKFSYYCFMVFRVWVFPLVGIWVVCSLGLLWANTQL